MKTLCAVLLLLPAFARGGAAYIAADLPPNVQFLRLMVGTSPSVYSRTSNFAVPVLPISQTVTNPINLFGGVTNYIAGQVIGINNTESDLSTNLVVTVQASPTNLKIVP